MKKLTLLMHTSLDGFTAGPNGEMDWILVNNEMFDLVGSKTNEADTALYGRVTYEMMDSYWPNAGDELTASKHDKEHSAWYNEVEKVVVSKTMKGAKKDKTTIISDDITSGIRKLKEQGGKDILMLGSGSTSHELMAENLIDEYWLFVNPVLLGEGMPLFKDVKSRTKLKLNKTHVFASGVIWLQYLANTD